ncbi:MAG: ABC transporter substrate-binding protein [Rickettsiales bacterium]
MKNKVLSNVYIVALIFIVIVAIIIFNKSSKSHLPLVAIANYGPHSSLEDSISGIKQELAAKGYIENKNIAYDIMDVGFDTALIPQMITKLKASKPNIIVAMTTPVAQFAKHNVKDIPIIYNVITDPMEAGLLKNKDKAENMATCTSDKQNIDLVLAFAKEILPSATRVGILYATSEANDIALVKMFQESTNKLNMELVVVAIDQPRDVPLRMQSFKDKVDFIYVGTSGPIQPTLPVIIAQADKMMIPVFNVNEEAVKNDQALASFGVSYTEIGKNTGNMIDVFLKTGKIMPPIYPDSNAHHGFISKKRAKFFNIAIPNNLNNVTIVE